MALTSASVAETSGCHLFRTGLLSLSAHRHRPRHLRHADRRETLHGGTALPALVAPSGARVVRGEKEGGGMSAGRSCCLSWAGRWLPPPGSGAHLEGTDGNFRHHFIRWSQGKARCQANYAKISYSPVHRCLCIGLGGRLGYCALPPRTSRPVTPGAVSREVGTDARPTSPWSAGFVPTFASATLPSTRC
jgi:hypothetical protein